MTRQTSNASVLVPLFSLMTSVTAWLGIGSGHKDWKLLAAFLMPLFLTAPGILQGKRYTHAWASFVAIIYLVIGITEVVANPISRARSGLVTVTALWFFVALICYIRRTSPHDLSKR